MSSYSPDPQPLVIGLVLLAAALHVSWNAIMKASGDPLLSVWLTTAACGLVGAAVAIFVPFPRPEAWPFLLASVALHLAYQLALARAYRLGALSHVYPIARGLAPCVAALLAVAVSGEWLSVRETLGLLIASSAIASLAFGRTEGPRGSVPAALVCGVLIGAYTLVDAEGTRRGGPALSFIAWHLVFDAVPITCVALAVRGAEIPAFLRGRAWQSVLGGVMAATAYGIVLWAMTRSRIAPIAALRETGVVMAALIGTRLLGEAQARQRILAAVLVVTGVVLLHWH